MGIRILRETEQLSYGNLRKSELHISDRHFRKEKKDTPVVVEMTCHLRGLNLISLSARLPFTIPDKSNYFPYPSFSSSEQRWPFKYLNPKSFKQMGKNTLFFCIFIFNSGRKSLESSVFQKLWLYAVAYLEINKTHYL